MCVVKYVDVFCPKSSSVLGLYYMMYFLPANNADIPFFLYNWAIARSVEMAGSEYRVKGITTLVGTKHGFIIITTFTFIQIIECNDIIHNEISMYYKY